MAWPRSLRLALVAASLVSLAPGAAGFLLGIDLGSQYFKSAVVAPGKPFEVVHNQHSKRKTPTAVSFEQEVRTFGDDALVSASKSVAKTPMLFPLQLGRNLTSVAAEQLSWLPSRYYAYNLGVNESGSMSFRMGEVEYTIEEATAHLLSFAKGLAVDTVDGAAVTETIITVPSSATMQQRRALLTSARIAGLSRPQLIHETSAAALQRAMDVDIGDAGGPGVNGSDPIEPNTSTVLFYNMGAKHTEACVVRYRGAAHNGKNTVAMDVLGCGISETLGGHQVDVIIADKMLAAFQAKHPKLADGIEKNVRALKKLEKQASATKHVLSANKEAQFRVESLYEDTDFFAPVNREDLDSWTAELFAPFSEPIQAALALANLTVEALEVVEMVGGGWRIPRIQTLLTEYLKAHRAPDAEPLILSQHINGDEAMATGAAFFLANSSVSFRTKQIFFTDSSPHGYDLVLEPLNASQPHEVGWARGVELFPAHGKLRAKKTVKLNLDFDLKATLLENGNPVAHWELSGIHEAAKGKYAELPTPLVSLKLELDSSGVVVLASAQAIFDELVPVVEIPKVNASAAANASEAENETKDASSNSEEPEASKEPEEAPADAEGAAENTSEVQATGTEGAPKMKVRKVKVHLSLAESFDGILPRPLSEEEVQQAVGRLTEMNAKDAEVRRTDAAKNALEGFIYESREKLNDDENCATVSTEDQRSQILEKLFGMEEWLYEDEAREANATVLEGKIQLLKDDVSPVLRRAWELEQRALLPELVDKVKEYANSTLQYVITNMTWVVEKETQGVAAIIEDFESWYFNATENQSKLELTEDPAYTVYDVKVRLERIRSESQRLTKIKKIDPMPYSSDYGGGYGGYGGKDSWKDPKMRDYYEQYYKNFSKNGTNYSDYFRNFSGGNFSNFKGNGSGDGNESDYMKSFRDFYDANASEEPRTESEKPSDASAEEAQEDGKSEL